MKIEAQQKLKALFDEGCEVRVSYPVVGLVSHFYEDEWGFNIDGEEFYIISLDCVPEDSVRVLREVMGWTGGES